MTDPRHGLPARRSRPGAPRVPSGAAAHRPPPDLPRWLPRVISSGRPRTPFVVFVLALLGIGITGGLVLNTMAAQRSFAASTLQDRDNALTQEQQGLQRDVQRLDTPQRLASEAARLGMVPAAGPAFLEVWPGGRSRVLGTPLPVVGPPPPVKPTPSTKPARSTKPTQSPKPPASTKPTATARSSPPTRSIAPTRPGTSTRPSTRSTNSPAGGNQ